MRNCIPARLTSFCLPFLFFHCGPADPSLGLIATATAEALGVEHTVCPVGSPQGPCDFATPTACAIGAGVTNGDICLVRGGTYHEPITFQATPFIGRTELVFRCAPGFACLIDGRGLLASGVDGYDHWTIEGFEITGTTGDAVTGYRGVRAVRDCYIHDVGGRGIAKLTGTSTATGVAERNRIERTWSSGIQCLAPPSGPVVIRNNLLVATGLKGGNAVNCTSASASLSVVHNTLDLADRTPPFADPAAYGILSASARANVVVGGNTSISVSGDYRENLVSGWAAAAYAGAGGDGGGNTTGAPSFVDTEDYHLLASSPAVDAAVTSTETEDFERSPRTGTPDKGAFEYAPGYDPETPDWPIRETVDELSLYASPALTLLPGVGGGPAVAYLDSSASRLVFARRLTNGTWRDEAVAAPVGTVSFAANGPNMRHVALAIEPTTGLPAVAWVDQAAGLLRLHYARRVGEGCGTGCASPQWSGCNATPLKTFANTDRVSFDLAMSPLTGRPGIVLWRQRTNGCGTNVPAYHVLYLSQQPNGTWTETELAATSPACTNMIPPAVALSFSPENDAAELAFTRTTGNANNFDPHYSLGELVFATNASGSFVTTVLALGDGKTTYGGTRAYLDLAHRANGDLGIAFHGKFGPGTGKIGVGFIERLGGVWAADASVPAWSLAGATILTVHGVALAYDAANLPTLGFASEYTLRLARFDGDRWDVRYVDAQRANGFWPTLALLPGGGVVLAHQQEAPHHDVKVQATQDPGGADPASVEPSSCDLCPTDPAKTAPGVCGCGTPDTDSDNDGTPNCNDGCPGDPAKVAAGTCGCGISDADSDGDAVKDCNEDCDLDPAKTDPGLCGCGVADTDSDSDGAPDCNDDCPLDPLKVAPGLCGCGVPEGSSCGCTAGSPDGDSDGTPDCADDCPAHAIKILPGICGCAVADTDTDNDSTPDCNDLCPTNNPKTSPGVCGCAELDWDTDSDGTPNCVDECPNDPGKIAWGICGCQVPETDSDGDSMPDCQDGCPTDPAKIWGGYCGCGVSDVNTDGDQVPDCADGCPTDYNKETAGECGCGVIDLDSDIDGVSDCIDGCPSDRDKTAPGNCGCNQVELDSDGDGTCDGVDFCFLDPNKTDPGYCGCHVSDGDTDGDGTVDCDDACDLDPGKTQPGLCGCGVADTDSDNDAFPDCMDVCPTDPNKGASAGTCGCGVSETDTDVDGVKDCIDGCPNDFTKTSPGACGCGTPDFDSDNDGHANCVDACPNDPNKWAAVGLCGCDVPDNDTDTDGTPDCLDGCPGDPNKVAIGICGCGVSDADTDGDTVLDCLEECDLDPAKSAAGVCGCGVPDTNSDGDAALDCLEECDDDPAKLAPGACGCGVADTNRDGDAVLDCFDGCPDDSSKSSPGTCGCGESDYDGDGDLVPDCNDGCIGDPAKTAPGACGCGVPDVDANSNGTADCLETNAPPVAVDDTASTEEETAVTIPVLANDSDPEGQVLTLIAVSSPANGTAVISEPSVVYTPAAGFVGTDSFTYTLRDPGSLEDTATVVVTVTESSGNTEDPDGPPPGDADTGGGQPASCGCSTSASSALPWLALLVFFPRLRRRRA